MATVSKSNRGRPPQRAEKRERALLDAAVTLFTRDGFHATSTRKIATTAGVSEGTLFNYFGSKNDLLRALLDHFYSELEADAREGVEQIMSTRERLRFLASNHVRALVANNALMLRLIQVYLSVDSNYYTDYRETHLHSLNYRYTRVFDRVIREGIARGDLLPELNLPALRDLFFGGLEYGMRTMLGRSGERDMDTHLDAIVSPLWHSMRAKHTAGETETREPAIASRLEAACSRLERAAERLENTGV